MGFPMIGCGTHGTPAAGPTRADRRAANGTNRVRPVRSAGATTHPGSLSEGARLVPGSAPRGRVLVNETSLLVAPEEKNRSGGREIPLFIGFPMIGRGTHGTPSPGKPFIHAVPRPSQGATKGAKRGHRPPSSRRGAPPRAPAGEACPPVRGRVLGRPDRSAGAATHSGSLSEGARLVPGSAPGVAS